MTSQQNALVIALVEEAVKDTPALITEFQTIFSVANPSPADWTALRTKVASESYEQYVPGTSIPPVTTPTVPTAVTLPSVS